MPKTFMVSFISPFFPCCRSMDHSYVDLNHLKYYYNAWSSINQQDTEPIWSLGIFIRMLCKFQTRMSHIWSNRTCLARRQTEPPITAFSHLWADSWKINNQSYINSHFKYLSFYILFCLNIQKYVFQTLAYQPHLE